MTAPVVPDLGASTVNRKWILEVQIAGSYVPVGGLKNFAPTTDDANMEDDGRYSDGGYSRMNKTGTGWNATATVSRAPQTANSSVYDVAQEYFRSHGEGQLGGSAQVLVRFYEYNVDATLPRVQAYQGTALVSWNEPGGERTGNSEATITLTGQGKLNSIVHPFPVTPVAPVLTALAAGSYGSSAKPATASKAGVQIRVTGSGLATTVANGVQFDGSTAAISYDVESDSLIIVSSPSLAAGNHTLTVTNAAGASNSITVVYA